MQFETRAMARTLGFAIFLISVAPCVLAGVSTRAVATASTRASAAEHAVAMIHKKTKEHVARLAHLHHSMTLASALNVIHRNTSSEVFGLVQEAISKKHDGRHHHHKQLRQVQIKAPTAATGGVDGASKLLNSMIEKVKEEYDVTQRKCCEYDNVQSQAIEEALQSISTYTAQAAGAHAKKSEASSGITLATDKIPELKDAGQRNKHKCEKGIGALELELKTATDDIETINGVLKHTQCNEESSSPSSFLMLSCNDSCGTYHTFDEGHRMHSASPRVQALTIQSLTSDLPEGVLPAGDSIPADFFQFDQQKPGTQVVTKIPDPRTLPGVGPCEAPSANKKRSGKCSLKGIPNCPVIREKFLNIQLDIGDKKMELEMQLEKLTKSCEKTKKSILDSIKSFKTRLGESQTDLSDATKTLNEANENVRQMKTQNAQYQKEYADMTEQCHDSYQKLENEECALEKIRGEVFNKLKTDKTAQPVFQDCVVSDWTAGECSVSCGGGISKMSRKVEIQANGGAPCPPLEEMLNCGMDQCPVNCRLNDWSGWSDCSAECGGGVTNRVRTVNVEPMNNGDPCGDVEETEPCNPESCSKDCELSDWTPWSTCSKECGGGSNERVRTIVAQAVGDGTCPDQDAKERYQLKECNTDVCVKLPGADTLKCSQKLDVVLLLDGSGSIGEDGWAATKKGGKKLVQAFFGNQSDAQVSVILYSGPVDYPGYYKCLYTSLPADELESLCGIKTLMGFSNDPDELVAAIEASEWPQGGTLPSMALQTARTQLNLGRDDAKSVVITFTDAKAASYHTTLSSSNKVKEVARLMWVPVTQYAQLASIKTFASTPWAENVVQVSTWNELEASTTVDTIISDSCSNIDWSR